MDSIAFDKNAHYFQYVQQYSDKCGLKCYFKNFFQYCLTNVLNHFDKYIQSIFLTCLFNQNYMDKHRQFYFHTSIYPGKLTKTLLIQVVKGAEYYFH